MFKKFILKLFVTHIIFTVLMDSACFGTAAQDHQQKYQEPVPNEIRCSKCSRMLEPDAKVSTVQLHDLVHSNKHIFCIDCTKDCLRQRYKTAGVPKCPRCGAGLDLYQHAPLITVDVHLDYYHQIGSSCRHDNRPNHCLCM